MTGEAVALVLSQDAITLTPDGQPWSAVSLNASEARELAARLLTLAAEIDQSFDDREKPGPPSRRQYPF